MIVVWYKRDLRIADHQPLTLAAQHGNVLPLYIIEPSVIYGDDYSYRHYEFVRQSLLDLRQSLTVLGQPLVVRQGEAVEVFDQLHHDHTLEAIYSHEETGNSRTYARDLEVHDWAQKQGVRFVEMQGSGVVRRLPTRDIWSDIWESRMAALPIPAPITLRGVSVDMGDIPTSEHLGLEPDGINMVQRGGETIAHTTIRSFLHARGKYYHRAMSSPVTAYDACSRISPYMAWGSLSMRQAFHTLEARQVEVRAAKANGEDTGTWGMALASFESRLHWRDHFIQKLEDAPRIERESFVTTYDGLRPSIATDWEARRRYIAWRDGKTGFPMVDACMRALKATGYLNFRMRAMVVSFASYDLCLDWRETGLVLARWFTDMEPGIHWSQMQMQSGTNGNSTLRIYNPTLQATQHDPKGVFIRKWLPELRTVPNTYISNPSLMPEDLQHSIGIRIGQEYPPPIVDHDTEYKAARAKINVVRQLPETKAQAKNILEKHGSRKRKSEGIRKRKTKKDDRQKSLFGEE